MPHLPRVEERETAAAAALVAREAEAVRRAMGHADADDEEYARAAVAVRGDWIVHAETGEPVPRRAAKPADRVAAAAAEHSRLRAEMEKDAKRAAKLEHKVELLTAGLRKRAEALGAQLVDLGAKIAAAEEERAAYARAARAGTARRAETHGGAHGTDGEGECQRTRVAGDVQSPRGGARRRQKRRVKRANRNDATVRVPDVHVSPVAL